MSVFTYMRTSQQKKKENKERYLMQPLWISIMISLNLNQIMASDVQNDLGGGLNTN